jgi:hypothetical protein
VKNTAIVVTIVLVIIVVLIFKSNVQNTPLVNVIDVSEINQTIQQMIVDNRTANQTITFDFTKQSTTHHLSYCVQEAGYPVLFSTTPLLKQLNKDAAGTGGYQRIWIERNSAYANTMPLNNDCTYNYTILDAYVQAVLDIGQIPHMMFVNSPYCLIKDKINNATANVTAVRVVMPDNMSTYINVVEVPIYQHYMNACGSGAIRGCGNSIANFNLWNWEIGNEPILFAAANTYDEWFVESYDKIKAINPNAKIGMGYPSETKVILVLQTIPSNKHPNFIDIHFYDDATSADAIGGFSSYQGKTYDEFMKGTEYAYKTAVDNLINTIRQYDKDVLVYNFEYNLDWSWQNSTGAIKSTDYMRQQEAAAWWVSAMHWQLQTELRGECWFVGTQYAFGLWNTSGVPRPSYFARKEFVKMFRPGDKLWFATSADKSIEAIANEKGMVFVNKFNQTVPLTNVRMVGKTYTDLIPKTGREANPQNSFYLSLKPYEVLFVYYT